MARARDIANIINSGTFLTPASASTTFLTQTSASTIYQGAPNRNLIINGAMQVAQRGTSTASITSSGYYTVDRFQMANVTLGTWTQSVENDAPTGSGFRKSLKVLCTTADAAPAAGDVLAINHLFEGQNLQLISKGTASAQQLTLSFWVKSNVTGTYIVNLRDDDNTRSVSTSYSVSASATWEKKTIVFPADTTGAFDNDNAGSLGLVFFLGAGTNFTSGTLNTSWASTVTANRAVGQTNLAAATNNYWQITGVQLEVGAVATPFEFKPFEQELKECQRYFEKSYDLSTPPGSISESSQYFFSPGAIASGAITATFPIQYKVPKRNATTAITYYSPVTGASGFIRNRKNGVSSEVDKNTGLGFASYGENMWTASLGSGVGATEYFNDDSSYVKFHWTSNAEL
jgi:hypothetical protein